ncbi:T9SS type A sorting domain-containing protein [Chryseobacterium sp. c4a]|uniref:T9SS type A sorting domain-containing protein n=1 Tax=Chryseobacterium sp. c4a TaxID=1573582 RepID=UPI00135AA851|nr:T9SS type A sorting domain-containing protein [Chryseobacterium sp. c4a]
MKNIYFFVLLLAQASATAQIINFPDPAFKAKLVSATPANYVAYNLNGSSTAIDTNNDGEIQVSEAQNISKLSFSSTSITDITGIQSFTNLTSLNASGNPLLTTVNVSNMTNLKEVALFTNALNAINTQGCNQLESFSFSGNSGSISNLSFLQNPSLKKLVMMKNTQLASADLSHLTGLEDLFIGESTNLSFTSLDLSNNINLKKIHIDKPNLTSLTFNTLSLLEDITINRTQIPSLDLTNIPKLSDLTLEKNSLLNTLMIQNNTNLEYVRIQNSPLLSSISVQDKPKLLGLTLSSTGVSSLNLTGSPKIFSVSLGGNKITSLDVSSVTGLIFLSLGEDFLTSIDVSQNTNLSSLSVAGNAITTVNVKNGKPNLDFTASPKSLTPNLAYVCCDTNKINKFSNMLLAYGQNNVVINDYCSFAPGGINYAVKGSTKYDSNNNGCDINDLNKASQKFNISNGSISGSSIGNSSGNYLIPLQAGTHTITPVVENPSYFTITPSSVNVTFPNQASPLIQDFCYTANGTHNDLEVVVIPVEAAVPGFDTQYKIVYKNKGTEPQSGNIDFSFNNSLMIYQTATVAPSTQSGGAIGWNFTNLLPFETKQITVTLKLNTPTQTPALNSGDILHYTAQISGATDETPADNNFTLNQTVVNSFDPNDKTCLEGATIVQSKVGDYVHYLIRFENTGTANARNIVVKDKIDTTKFDISSLVALNGSHDFVTRITQPNIAEFIFENIQLPSDDANNDGYVSFKIKTKSTLTLGDSFSNTANIYFDYNHPIITNTFTTSVQNKEILATSETNGKIDQFIIYPNPVKDILNIKTKETINKIEIYDLAGRIINSKNVKENSVNVSDLIKGSYLIKLFLKDKVFVQKFIKK